MEGTWAAPSDVDRALELHALMKEPLPAGQATDKLYNLIGDDDLFDDIGEAEMKDGPDADVRYLVKSKVAQWIKNYDPNDWRTEWDADAIRILQDMM